MSSNNSYKKRRERGQCAMCKQPSERFRCDECRKKANEYNNRVRQQRRSLGQCIRCGCKPCLCPKREWHNNKRVRLAEKITEELGIEAGRLEAIEAVEQVLKRYCVSLWKNPRKEIK